MDWSTKTSLHLSDVADLQAIEALVRDDGGEPHGGVGGQPVLQRGPLGDEVQVPWFPPMVREEGVRPALVEEGVEDLGRPFGLGIEHLTEAFP